MIAIALAAEPLLLIADEPTTALDVTVQAQVLDLLADIQRELGMAVLLITHDLAVVKNVAHHVALMRGGEIVESASAEEFFRAPRHPYARQLFDAIPTFDKRGAPLTEQGRQARQGSRRGERGAGAVVLDVQDLQVHYPVRAAAPHRVLGQGGRRRVLHAARRRDAGPAGRVRLRQDHHRQGAAAPDRRRARVGTRHAAGA